MTSRTHRFAVALTVLAVVAVAPMAAASAAFAQSSSKEVLATLKVTSEKVEVKKRGADKFKEAKDGDKLRQGDTVRTDGSGLAEIDYSADSYTRLDVNTTFKIKRLTEDQGSRQVQGSLETGQAWSRTEALTESGSFGLEGAGANAVTRGTAFNGNCIRADYCVFTGIFHDVDLEGIDGVTKLLTPLDQCDSTSGVLCGDITKISPADLPQWIQDNLLQDLLEHGFGPGPFAIVVQGGSVFFIPAALPGDPVVLPVIVVPPTVVVPPIVVAAPAFDNANPVFVSGIGCGSIVACSVSTGGSGVSVQVSCAAPPSGFTCASGLRTEDEVPLLVRINASDPGNLPFTVRFSTLPSATVGVICGPRVSSPGTNPCQASIYYAAVATHEAIVDNADAPLNKSTQFASDTEFVFAPADYEPPGPPPLPVNPDSLTVTATNSAGSSATSDPIPVTVCEAPDEGACPA